MGNSDPTVYVWIFRLHLCHSTCEPWCDLFITDYRSVEQHFVQAMCKYRLTMRLPAPARSKEWIYGRSPARIAGSNPAGSMNTSFGWVLCVVKVLAMSVIANPHTEGLGLLELSGHETKKSVYHTCT